MKYTHHQSLASKHQTIRAKDPLNKFHMLDVPIIYLILECEEYANARFKTVEQGGVLLGQKPKMVKKIDCVQTQGLIYGGEHAKVKEFPHMVSTHATPSVTMHYADIHKS